MLLKAAWFEVVFTINEHFIFLYSSSFGPCFPHILYTYWVLAKVLTSILIWFSTLILHFLKQFLASKEKLLLRMYFSYFLSPKYGVMSGWKGGYYAKQVQWLEILVLWGLAWFVLKAGPIKLNADKTKFGSKLAHLRFQQELWTPSLNWDRKGGNVVNSLKVEHFK